ncbi:hypothetical protein K439DRAFT_1350815 [Ramaria rubella]|nr:hypothetical protein K439DRAFT_1350815 [Ramaria rubella]
MRISTGDSNTPFPPRPKSSLDIAELIREACEAMNPSEFEEVGCMICGRLTLKSSVVKKKDANIDCDILVSERDMTRKE